MRFEVPVNLFGFRRVICFEHQFYSSKPIVSIGCDCHPAYVLQDLNLRIESLPFDWLNVDTVKGLDFARENITENFASFLSDLYYDTEGYIVSEKFPYAQFYHEKDLIDKVERREKLQERAQRFLKIIDGDAFLLYTFLFDKVKSKEELEVFTQSVRSFCETLNTGQSIHIYVRVDEFEQGQWIKAKRLSEVLSELPSVIASCYLVQKNKFDLWGDPRLYPALLKSLKIQIKQKFPKIYLRHK